MLINSSYNALPYALTWYLDAVAEHWDALVLNDYEAVMPLVWFRKLGIKCLYQPYYCQQLGVFSLAPVSAVVYGSFLNIAKARFAYTNINLNSAASVIANDFVLRRKKNLLLSLNQPVTIISKQYSSNHRRSITKAGKAGLVFSTHHNLKSFQQFYLGNVNRVKENFKPKHEKIFKKLSSVLLANRLGEMYSVTDSSGNLMAAALFVIYRNRLTGIINTSSAEGKKNCASHFLFDHVIQKYAGQNRVLDFEGSSIASIARFYEGFGATEEIFYNYQNTLLKSISQRLS